jgi:hypothetical protein
MIGAGEPPGASRGPQVCCYRDGLSALIWLVLPRRADPLQSKCKIALPHAAMRGVVTRKFQRFARYSRFDDLEAIGASISSVAGGLLILAVTGKFRLGIPKHCIVDYDRHDGRHS